MRLTHSFRGTRYTISFSPHRTNLGTCDEHRSRHISIDSHLDGRPRLNTIIHECIHACLPDLDESVVGRTSCDIGRLLWRLGYRSPPAP